MVAPAVQRVFDSEIESSAYVQRFAFDEKEESRILQPYGQSRSDAKIRAPFSRCVPFFREGTDAHGAGSRRSLHEHYSARLSFARRSVDFAFPRGSTQLYSNAIARLRQTNSGAHDARSVA